MSLIRSRINSSTQIEFTRVVEVDAPQTAEASARPDVMGVGQGLGPVYPHLRLCSFRQFVLFFSQNLLLPTMQTGEKIRIIRIIKGLSQENMADELGMTRFNYGEIERGKTTLNEKRIEQIAKVLGVTPKFIHNFDDMVSNFFDQANHNAVNVGDSPIGPQINNYHNQQELQHQLEISRLENENIKLDLENQRISREKAELEATIWRERFERMMKTE
jgi:XRE family transcriptional regulator, regulator of sulfur utilization